MKAKATMIRSTSKEADDRPTLVWIPGGPGLSSYTLRPMDLLKRSFHLVYIDPPGTGGQPAVSHLSFEDAVQALEAEISQIKGDIVLCGHSFGALLAISLLAKFRVEGIVCLASPLTLEAIEHASKVSEENMTPELSIALGNFEESPTSENFLGLFEGYKEMYFHPSNVVKGTQWIKKDKPSPESFGSQQSILSDSKKMTDLMNKLKSFSGKKLLVAASDDILFVPKFLKEHSEEAGMQFELIQDAGHFLIYDQPEKVAKVIEKYWK